MTENERLTTATFDGGYPSYESTHALDELRASEYTRLDSQGQTYLDYTAGNLYATSQLDRHMALLRERLFGNPHSTNPTSLVTTDLVEQARSAVAARFGVAVSSVVKWSQRHRMTGSVAPGKMGGHRKPILEPHREFILERIGQVCQLWTLTD